MSTPAERGVAHVFRRLEVEARQAEQVAEHAQHLPGRPRLAERLDDAVEALHPAFGIDEGARGFGERRDRQHHVGDVRGRGLERGQRDDHVGRGERGARGGRVGGVERRLDVEQQHRLEPARPPEHLAGVEPTAPAAARRRAARRRCWPLRRGSRRWRRSVRRASCASASSAAGLRVLRGGVAEQHRLALARQQRRRRSPVRRSVASPGSGAATPLACATAAQTSASACTQPLGATVMRPATGISQSSSTRVHARTPLPPLRAAWRMRCANSGWSLRRNEPTTSTRCSVGQRRDRRAEPARAAVAAPVGEVGVAQAGGRCCRCRGRARAAPAGAVPRPCGAAMRARRCAARRASPTICFRPRAT